MKRVLFVVLTVMFVMCGCAKAPVSATDKIVEHYKTICKTNDSSVIRNEIAELDKLSKDASISEQERMLAQYTYNIGYGVAKVDLSGKAISVFDFPEIELLSALFNDESKLLPDSNLFVKTVNNC